MENVRFPEIMEILINVNVKTDYPASWSDTVAHGHAKSCKIPVVTGRDILTTCRQS
jgi:hypothetical protein